MYFYIAVSSGPLQNNANQAPGVQTGTAQGIKSFHRLIMGYFF